MNWAEFYPAFFSPLTTVDPDETVEEEEVTKQAHVQIADVGCGFGGLSVALAKMFPEKLVVGMEIRDRVVDVVQARVKKLREDEASTPGGYQNLACVRVNAMKHLPNYFYKGQLEKIFFLFPDPHFKKRKHRRRIISPTLLAEYAYVLAEGGIAYTNTDVEDLHVWMVKHFTAHPLFVRIPDEELNADPILPLIMDVSEEGQKVAKQMGAKYPAAFRRIPCP
eukprot:TRINITY_DN3841_c0_g1_i1.p1 TRINITY_DN3841_c0_g1~~TRINITY_DN3841_c0_g1_i1.p1  ORF type:complete len:222 (-),score=37.94 TRINITY_DN3841_c0_g1_i1:24-689(-)